MIKERVIKLSRLVGFEVLLSGLMEHVLRLRHHLRLLVDLAEGVLLVENVVVWVMKGHLYICVIALLELAYHPGGRRAVVVTLGLLLHKASSASMSRTLLAVWVHRTADPALKRLIDIVASHVEAIIGLD